MEKSVIYFDRPGAQNTAAVTKAVRRSVEELGVRFVVVASSSGATALKLWKELQGLKVSLVAVAEHAGRAGGDKMSLTEKRRKELEAKGIKVLVASHVLAGVARSITNKFGGISHVEIIAHTLRQFAGDGIKVAVEASVMAADAGLVPTKEEIIAIGGTRSGADSAIVLMAAHMNNFFDLEIREIIAKPRQQKSPQRRS